MAAARAEARKNSWSMTIVSPGLGLNPVMMRNCGRLANCRAAGFVGFSRMTRPYGVRHFYKRPTKALQDALAKGAADWRYLTFPRMIAADGGLPILVPESPL